MVSNKHLYVQFVDDDQGSTLCSVSTVKKNAGLSKSVEKAKELGLRAAEEARKKGISSIVFDRGGFRYHGRVKAIADAMRESGMQF
jgi:large subunit ribosomal protein L18